MDVLTQSLKWSKSWNKNNRIFSTIFSGELTLVDWKTINAQSEKSRSEGEKTTSDLYSNPVQIAAYVAAVNSDPAYAFLPPIKRAAVVLTYEDGRGVEIVSMGEEDIEVTSIF